MKTLTGTYGKDCKIFTDNIEPQALETIQKLLDNPVTEGKPVRIMPDTHDGKGIVIGFTMPMGEWVNPNHIGVDIGCVTLFASNCKGESNSANPSEYIGQDDDGMWYVETAPSQEDMRRRTLESYRYLFGRMLRM